MARFSNKVVLVAGAASGIGEEAARRFGREGATLVVADQNAEDLREAAERIEASDILTHVADLSDADQCRGTVEAAVARFGRLDVLVNNAGKDPLGKVDLADFSTVIETGLYGVFYMTRFALPMQDQPELVAEFEERIPMGPRRQARRHLRRHRLPRERGRPFRHRREPCRSTAASRPRTASRR